ncbi:unnamed protein product, partial [Ectocarpus sp. 4 AP-2014]
MSRRAAKLHTQGELQYRPFSLVRIMDNHHSLSYVLLVGRGSFHNVSRSSLLKWKAEFLEYFPKHKNRRRAIHTSRRRSPPHGRPNGVRPYSHRTSEAQTDTTTYQGPQN